MEYIITLNIQNEVKLLNKLNLTQYTQIEKNLIKKEISLNILFLKMEFLMRSLKPQNKIDQQYIVGIFLKEMESFKQKS